MESSTRVNFHLLQPLEGCSTQSVLEGLTWTEEIKRSLPEEESISTQDHFSLLPEELRVIILSNLHLGRGFFALRRINKIVEFTVTNIISESFPLIQQLMYSITKKLVHGKITLEKISKSFFITLMLSKVTEIRFGSITAIFPRSYHKRGLISKLISLIKLMPNIQEVDCSFSEHFSSKERERLLGLCSAVKKVNITGNDENILSHLPLNLEGIRYRFPIPKTGTSEALSSAFTSLLYLKVVDISDNKIVNENVLKSLSNTVEVLKLKWRQPSKSWPFHGKNLGSALSHLTNLKKLDLEGASLNGKALTKVSQSIEELSLNYCKSLRAQNLTKAFLHLTSIKELKMHDTRITGEDLIRVSQTLEGLDLTSCEHVLDENLGPAFVRLVKLKWLKMDYTWITGKVLIDLNTTVEKLSLVSCYFLTNQNLAPALAHLTNLGELEAIDTKITGEGFTLCNDALAPVSSPVKKLDLSNCTFLNDQNLDIALKQLLYLKELKLSGTAITGEGLAHLNPTLGTLILDSCNNLKDAHLEAALQKLTNLRKLSANDTLITSEGLVSISPTVEELSLKNCVRLSHQNLNKICSHLWNLKKVEVSENTLPISSSSVLPHLYNSLRDRAPPGRG